MERLAFAAILFRPARCYSCYKRFHVLRFRALKPRGARRPQPDVSAAPSPVPVDKEKLSA